MMFAGRAAAAKANILFDIGASANIVSKSFAKQTGITLKRLARKGVLTSLLGFDSSRGVRLCSACGGLCCGFVSGRSNLICLT
jgi:hypothetical protein